MFIGPCVLFGFCCCRCCCGCSYSAGFLITFLIISHQFMRRGKKQIMKFDLKKQKWKKVEKVGTSKMSRSEQKATNNDKPKRWNFDWGTQYTSFLFFFCFVFSFGIRRFCILIEFVQLIHEHEDRRRSTQHGEL